MKLNANVFTTNLTQQNTTINKTSKDQDLLLVSGNYSEKGDTLDLSASSYIRSQNCHNENGTNSIKGCLSLTQSEKENTDTVQLLLQQGKELATKANSGMLTVDEKQAIQNKIDRLNQQIDTLCGDNASQISVSYVNGTDDQDIINCLKSNWLEEAETVIASRYGLAGDGSLLKVVLEEDDKPYLAAIYYNYDAEGKAVNQTMHVVIGTAIPATLPNGGEYPMYDDRVIAHEMVHVIMGRNMNFESLPKWFKEGTAEFIHGADERVERDLERNGGDMEGATAIQDALDDGTDDSWVNDSIHYSAAFMAVRYLHEKIKESGHSGGIKDLMADLQADQTETLDQALSHVSEYTSVEDFIADFVENGNGASFIHYLDVTNELTDADTGAIGGEDADGGPVQTAESVIPDFNHYTEQPLKYFTVTWPSLDQYISAGSGYSLGKLDSEILGIRSVGVVDDPSGAINAFDDALALVENRQIQLDKIQSVIEQAWEAKQSTTANEYTNIVNYLKQNNKLVEAQANHSWQQVLQLLA